MGNTTGDRPNDFLDFHLDDSRFTFWNILPPASEQRFTLIKESVANDTWAGRIVVDELGRILFGHDDYRAFRALHKPPRHIVHVKVGDRCTRADVEGLIRLWRYCDGGLATREERREAIRHQLRITPHWSNREISRVLGEGIDKNTVQGQREHLEETGEIHQFIFPGGRGQTRGLPMILYRDRQEAKRNEAMFRDAKGLEGQTSPKQLRRAVVKNTRRRMAEDGSAIPLAQDFRLECCDFRDLKIEPGMLDIGFTDPPWESQFVDDHLEDFARIAAESLKPGGLLVLYPSMYDLDRVMAVMGRHLTYCWEMSIHYASGNTSNAGTSFGVKARHRTLLFYCKGGKYRHPEGAEFYYDTYYTDDYDPAKDKDRHEWQQDFEAAYYYLSRLSFPGMTVADWFVGGGTFPAAVKALGQRKFVGCDVSQDCINTTKKILADVEPGKGSDSSPIRAEPPGEKPG